ncbi:hypothetical protein EMPS_09985 [Entomortierella parvispora]|uniref:Tf2-1-like SH3-like domain-containing protein n=1 Tax=Entomortierella parvispora TaxID=205924 RepID=A0A9P3HJ90_9FUNG|nr:hypothetical protein EMPS_09985 [Entomortierella parvispora]
MSTTGYPPGTSSRDRNSPTTTLSMLPPGSHLSSTTKDSIHDFHRHYHQQLPYHRSTNLFRSNASDSDAQVMAQEHLHDAQLRHSHQAHKHQRNHTFKIGDQGLLSTDHSTALADQHRPSRKLQAKFIGPYTILEQRSPVSFRLELPSSLRIHDVFHMDRLRAYSPSQERLGERTPARPPPETIDGVQAWEVEEMRLMEVSDSLERIPEGGWHLAMRSDLQHCPDILKNYGDRVGGIFVKTERCNRIGSISNHRSNLDSKQP